MFKNPLGERSRAVTAAGLVSALLGTAGLPLLAHQAGADTVLDNTQVASITAGNGTVQGNTALHGLSSPSNGVSTATITVTANAGSNVYGVDARICEPGADLQFSADLNPTQTGHCAPTALGAGGSALVSVATAPPNLTATLSFNIVPGSSTWTDSGGTTHTITCDYTTNATPCGLWLRIAVPAGQNNGTEFKHYDLTFAGPAGAPTALAGTPGDTTANLTWTPPSNTGDAPIDYYVVTPSIAGVPQAPINTPNANNSFNVTGLTNFTAYTFDVQAHNASGFVGTAATSGTVTPAPPAPGGVTASAANAQATVTWSPVSGTTPTRYRVTPYVGGLAQAGLIGFTVNGTTTTLLVTGLTNGTTYTFTVAAEYPGPNYSQDSAPSPAVTPSNIYVQQTIIATRPQGALTLTEAGNTVTMPAATLNANGTLYLTSAPLNTVTLTDTRDTNPGWNVNAQVSSFVSGLNSFPSTNLGWVPALGSAAPTQTVTMGGTVAPGTNPGLSASTPFASAPAGAGLGVATFDATLNLQIPVATPSGTYSATMTITAV